MSKLCSRCGQRPQRKSKVWCSPCSLEYERERWNNLPISQRRAKWLKSKYKLTYEQYQEMYDNQEGCCAICSISINIETTKNGRDTACVDHCHSTLKIRGLLCNHCNRALGLMSDSKENLKRMINYLEENE